MTNKEARAKAIHQSALAIASYYNVSADRMFAQENSRGEFNKLARGVLIYHLVDQGMSRVQIARLFRKGENCIRDSYTDVKKRLESNDFALIASLPRIPAREPKETATV